MAASWSDAGADMPGGDAIPEGLAARRRSLFGMLAGQYSVSDDAFEPDEDLTLSFYLVTKDVALSACGLPVLWWAGHFRDSSRCVPPAFVLPHRPSKRRVALFLVAGSQSPARVKDIGR